MGEEELEGWVAVEDAGEDETRDGLRGGGLVRRGRAGERED